MTQTWRLRREAAPTGRGNHACRRREIVVAVVVGNDRLELRSEGVEADLLDLVVLAPAEVEHERPEELRRPGRCKAVGWSLVAQDSVAPAQVDRR